MLGLYIANFIMKSPKMSKEDVYKADVGNGFLQAFKDYEEKWEHHSFELKSDDAIIRGEYVVNPSDAGLKKHVAIISHGITARREADYKYGKIYYDLGYNLVIFDHRYFGESEAPYCTLGDKETGDLKQIIAYARSVFGKDCFLGLHGESMGAATCLMTLDTEKPDFVVADCPFCDLALQIHELASAQVGFLAKGAEKRARKIGLKRYNYDFTKVRPIDVIDDCKVPVCFMHGAEDKVIKCEHSKRLFEKCVNPLSRLFLYENTDHAYSIVTHPKLYAERVKEFVEAVENAGFR